MQCRGQHGLKARHDFLHQGPIDQFANPAAPGLGLQNVLFGCRARRRIRADARPENRAAVRRTSASVHSVGGASVKTVLMADSW